MPTMKSNNNRNRKNGTSAGYYNVILPAPFLLLLFLGGLIGCCDGLIGRHHRFGSFIHPATKKVLTVSSESRHCRHPLNQKQDDGLVIAASDDANDRSTTTTSNNNNNNKNPLASFFLAASLAVTTTSVLTASSSFAYAYSPLDEINSIQNNNAVQGIGAVTQSQFGQQVRGAVVGGAQIVDSLDLKWERFSDSLRDEQKCDPRTNRRMFDNGTRKDGTKIGNPVLGALCTPEPLRDLDSEFANRITQLAEDAAITRSTGATATATTTDSDAVRSNLRQKEEQVKEKVGPAFARATRTNTAAATAGGETVTSSLTPQELARQTFNRDLYIRMRSYGEAAIAPPNNKPENYRAFETNWGRNMLTSLAPNANRNDYSSLFPKPDPTDEQPYDEGLLLDALGGVSVCLNKLQEAGLIGHWEISIPEDDYWNVVTIAVDDDISIGGQILARESKLPLSGSAVVGIVRSAMEDQAKISYKIDTFFIDPTTTRQELYNPTQLLVSLSDLGQ
jgi:hypothetical protein